MTIKLPSNIAYFVSGHGFGHGLRSSQLINALPATCRVSIYTTLPEPFFRREVIGEFDFIDCEVDLGCVQHDSLAIDIHATYEAYADIEKRKPRLIDQLCQKFTANDTEFIIGDIPAIPFVAAAEANIPSLAISNFTWCDVYSAYTEKDDRFEPLLNSIRSDYANADCYARLYPAVSTSPFESVRDVGLLCRTRPVDNREALAAQLGLDPAKKWCLIYLGKFGMEGVNWHRLADYNNWQFMGLYPLSGSPQNYLQLSHSANLNYGSLTANSDLVLGKLGYGLVSECLYQGVPVAYPARQDFCEHAVLAHALEKHGLGYLLSAEEFLSCDLLGVFARTASSLRTRYQDTAEQNLLEIIAQVYKRG